MTGGMDAALKALIPWIEQVARPYTRGPIRAEFDDLRQEGLISCWMALRKGVGPSEKIVKHRMHRWCVYVNRPTGMSYRDYMDEPDAE